MHGSANRARQKNVGSHVRPLVDAGEDDIEWLVIEPLVCENHAVGGRSLYGVGLDTLHRRANAVRPYHVQQRHSSRYAAPVPVGSDYVHLTDARKRLG